jgi:nucleoside-diphosphate-sugar epimerase
MASVEDWAIPKGSTVLVTAANGFIGSHIADQFLHHGFKVRGTVRNVDKNAWLTSTFDKKYGSGRFELWNISDMAAEGAFDDAVKGTPS